MIEVRLFATLRENREKILYLESSQHKSVEDILISLSIPIDEIAICLINGFHNKVNALVKDNDIISLFPPVGGG